MKRTFACSLLALTAVISGAFIGCDMGTGGTTHKDYNADIQEVAPENITDDNFVAEENTVYYTSKGLLLWMEVNGAFFKVDYFSLDGNKRVYDNVYLYEKDYFYMAGDDMDDWYASLGDVSDSQYAEEEKEQGYDIQINVKKSGIYKLTFDVDTLKFDMEYKAEIENPVYHTIEKCEIYSKATQWVKMDVNPDNSEEFVIRDFAIDVNENVSFYDTTHTSLYKITLDESCNENYASYRHPSLTVSVGGRYNVYINAKTYVVRLELLNPDTAVYSCVYYDGEEFIELKPYEEDVPYIFHQQFVVNTKYTTEVPDFHTAKYKTYNLSVVKSSLLIEGKESHYFKEPGTYNLIINLKTFEITVERLPE